jgi:hypothetical protein
MKHVDDEIHVIDQDPSSTAHPFESEWADAFLPQFLDDMIPDRRNVSIGAASGDQKKIGCAGHGPKVEQHHILSLTVEKELYRPRDLDREI